MKNEELRLKCSAAAYEYCIMLVRMCFKSIFLTTGKLEPEAEKGLPEGEEKTFPHFQQSFPHGKEKLIHIFHKVIHFFKRYAHFWLLINFVQKKRKKQYI